MVRQRLERWRGEAGRREAGAAVRLGLRGGAAAAVRSFLRPWAPRGFSDAGVISSFVSYVCKVATGRYGPSLGASGAIMTVLAAVCTKIPEGRLAIIFLPMFTFTAGNALKAIIAMDTAGMILGWKFFDHAAHLGGALFGIWYITYGHELIWKNREPLVKIWHEMRTNSPKKGGGSK
uniref:Presenilin-associated rhomboid-like protein, mitochondrial n=1 Tax=Rousettus aegyptiacus TaxID=9407 RepID=A0A7J8HSB6_ROUAE|nr:hypothetical protein HJG63_010934 [Rousettus aegyptiacus]